MAENDIVAAAAPPTRDQHRYRADIDGLRAVAVLAVVAFHAQIFLFRGGFAGVDVFFVISGYLISGIIFGALERGTFSFAEFYTRRVNRIFPALIVVLLATAAAGWVLLFPPEFASLGKHLLGSSGFVSNVVLWKESGYFDSTDKPLLHLWSLAVEEQFYIVWPLVLSIAWKKRWNMMVTICVIIAASFAANIAAVTHYAGLAAFYLPVTRFWEILSGAALCWWQLKEEPSRDWRSNRMLTEGLSLIGLVLIVAAIMRVRSTTPWPGWYALLPVVGTLAIVAAGEKPLVNRLLAWRPVVAIGLISYPLYLWHWPLFVLGRLVNEGPLSRTQRASIILASFVLAAATYQFVERPIRFGRRKRRSALRLVGALASVAIVGLAIKTEVIQSRMAPAYKALVQIPDGEMPHGGYFDRGNRARGSLIPGGDPRIVAFLGDSHAAQYRPRFDALESSPLAKNPSVVFYSYGGCPPFPGVNRTGISWDGSPWRCDLYHQLVAYQLMRPEVTTIVYAAHWEAYFDRDLPMFLASDNSKAEVGNNPEASDSVFRMFEREIASFRSAGKQVYVVLANPNSPSNNPKSLLPRRLPWLAKRSPVLYVPRQEAIRGAASINDRVRAEALRAGAVTIDPLDFLCPNGRCPTVDDRGRPMYSDDHHLRPSYVRERVSFLDVVLSASPLANGFHRESNTSSR